MSEKDNQEVIQPEVKLRLEELQEEAKPLSDAEMKGFSGGVGPGKTTLTPATNGKGYKMG